MKKNLSENGNKRKKILLFGCIVIAVLFFYHTSAAAAYMISLNREQSSMREVLDEIERLTPYTFLYSDDIIDAGKNVVTVDVKDKPVENVLDELFEGSDIAYHMVGNQVVLSKKENEISPQAVKQDKRTITGIVKDAEGFEMPGVSILVKGTTQGMVTNIDGKYSIEVPENSVLVFTMVGYVSQEVRVANQSTLNIILKEDVRGLEEVVVVGYSTQKKADLTGAVASVRMGDINDLPVANINSALQGRMSGVTVLQSSGAPGSTTSVRVRGLGTFGNNEPLYIIDGVPVDNMNDLNPNDIERVDVLKDAASAAIYGSRAANGVVLIQTKKGKDTGKVNVSLNTYHGFATPQRKIDLLNAQQRNMIHLEAYENDNRQYVFGEKENRPNPEAYYNSEEAQRTLTNWQDEIFSDAAYQGNYDLSVSGAAEKIRYSIMAGHLMQDGTLKNTDFARTTFRVNTEVDVIKDFKIGENLMISHSIQSLIREMGSSGAISTALLFDPSQPVYDPTGENKFSGSGPLGANIRNPYSVVDRDDRTRTRDRVFGNIYAEYTFLNDFTIKTDFGYDWSKWQEMWFSARVPEGARRNMDNELTQKEWQTTRWLNTTTLRYNKTIDKHKVMALGGFSYEELDQHYLEARGTDFINEEKSQRVMEGATQIAWVDGNKYEWAMQSYFARLDYSYADKYLFTANFRADASTRFLSNNRWGYFPSVSAGWRISEEAFFESFRDNIEQLKLRVSWGQLGNQNILNAYYPAKSKISNTTANDGYYVVFGKDENAYLGRYESNLPNPDIKWEVTTQTDIGLDFAFLGKFDVSLDYFNKVSNDVLFQLPLISLVGLAEAPWVNCAKVRNRGVDLNVSYQTKVSDWNIGFYGNLGKVDNKVLDTGAQSKVNYPTSYSSTSITRIIKGESIGHFYGLQTAGIFKSQAEIDGYVDEKGNKIQPQAVVGDVKFVDRNGDGVIDEKDRTTIGSGFPDFTYNFGFDVEYKGFDLNVFFQGVSGMDIFNTLKYDGMFMDKRYNQFEAILDRFHPTANPNGNFPRVTTLDRNGNRKMSDLFVDNGDYLRLKSITLGYTLDKKLTEKIHLQKVRVYATAQNLFTITKYKGFDPELGETYANEIGTEVYPMEIGVDRGQFPQPKTFILGVNINF